METKHTPGPWFYEEASGYVRCIDMSTVADAFKAFEKPQSDFNGLLIAAAPELFDALVGFVAEFGDKAFNANVHAARAAIAKATGRAP